MVKSKRQNPAPSLENSLPFLRLTTSFYLPLSPCAYQYALEGLCAEHLSPHLLTYYPPLRGVMLSYSNPHLSERAPAQSSSHTENPVYCQSIGEYGVSFVWLTAEFLVFRPSKKTILEGQINLQSESVVGLMCYNYFNASIEREKLPKDWKWDGQSWTNDGKPIQGGMSFAVEDFEPNGDGGITITGNLMSGS